jgi:pimeloyl-ACP methyl ester carboxylesterase
MQGTEDPVYSVPNAEEEIRLFTNSAGAELRVVDGGRHFLSATHPDVVDSAAVDFVKRWA